MQKRFLHDFSTARINRFFKKISCFNRKCIVQLPKIVLFFGILEDCAQRLNNFSSLINYRPYHFDNTTNQLGALSKRDTLSSSLCNYRPLMYGWAYVPHLYLPPWSNLPWSITYFENQWAQTTITRNMENPLLRKIL